MNLFDLPLDVLEQIVRATEPQIGGLLCCSSAALAAVRPLLRPRIAVRFDLMRDPGAITRAVDALVATAPRNCGLMLTISAFHNPFSYVKDSDGDIEEDIEHVMTEGHVRELERALACFHGLGARIFELYFNDEQGFAPIVFPLLKRSWHDALGGVDLLKTNIATADMGQLYALCLRTSVRRLDVGLSTSRVKYDDDGSSLAFVSLPDSVEIAHIRLCNNEAAVVALNATDRLRRLSVSHVRVTHLSRSAALVRLVFPNAVLRALRELSILAEELHLIRRSDGGPRRWSEKVVRIGLTEEVFAAAVQGALRDVCPSLSMPGIRLRRVARSHSMCPIM